MSIATLSTPTKWQPTGMRKGLFMVDSVAIGRPVPHQPVRLAALSRSASQTGVRVTNERSQLGLVSRFLLWAGMLAVMVIGGAASGALVGARGDFSSTIAYPVSPGESLWSIAAAHTPAGESVDTVVQAIYAANQLDNSIIQTGQVLLIPQK